MFSGIIEEIGTLQELRTRSRVKKFLIAAPKTAKKIGLGASVNVDGICLTVIGKTKKTFIVEVMPETLARTIAAKYRLQQKVNLEPALRLGDSLNGHFVSGHVDFCAAIKKITKKGGSKILSIASPPKMAKYFALKGSVTINGVSLTISKLGAESFEVSLIPYSQKTTNLGKLQKGNLVNIEIDLITRYLEKLL